ncbi:hypothetical protein ACFYRJ_41415 [Streptomyces sp. NPDC005531]|uniref:hypothetical protein n=1 Tax=Streptomyces sp. NPDC005531 TaxID=3364722 RepID=UPI00367885D7
MTHQHDMQPRSVSSGEGEIGLTASVTQTPTTPRILRVTVGKHFNLSVSLSASPTFLTVLALGVGAVGGNYWFLL